MTGLGWHRVDHMQTICTSLQIDNHANTSSLNFYRVDALSDAQSTVSKDRRQNQELFILFYFMSGYMCGLEKEIMQGTMPGARMRGRPRTAWVRTPSRRGQDTPWKSQSE